MAAFSETDYEAIEAAVLNTARGRWFLTEYARRNRAADTCTLLDAIRKLETGFKAKGAMAPEAVAEIDEVAKSISAAKVELTEVASEITGEVVSRRVLDALVRLAQAEDRLESLVGQHASGIAAANAGLQPLTSENLSYFREDEELFAAPKTAPAGQRRPEAVASQPSIRGTAITPAQPPQAAAKARAVASPSRGELPSPRPSEQGHGKPRILVVRSRPSEETRIPFEEEPGPVAH